MYKCSECGAEYEIKPEYCDCGNDVFKQVIEEEVKPQPKPQEQSNSVKTPPKPPAREIPKFEQTAPQPPKPRQTYDYSKIKNFFDPISTLLFLGCIGIAIYITLIGYDFNKPVKQVETEQSQVEVTSKNIPSVDAFWDNTPAKRVIPTPVASVQEQNIVQKEEQVLKPITLPAAQVMPPKTQPQPKAQPIQQTSKSQPKTAPKTTQNSTSKSSSSSVSSGAKAVAKKPAEDFKAQQAQKEAAQKKSATKTSTPKATNTSSATTAKSAQTSTNNSQGIDLNSILNNNKNYSNKSANTSTTPTNSTVPKSTSTSTQTTKTQTQTTATATNTNTKPATSTVSSSSSSAQTQQSTSTPKTVDPAVLKQELANYKIGLRNTIGKKIDFSRVVGDGECALSFSLDSSGRLLNRKFTRQSTNVTLNDAVYAAVNSMTRYNPPPAGYKNETLNLSIRFYNGNFSISLN